MNTNTSMASGSEECLIWPGFPADRHHFDGRKRRTDVIGSPRAGGDYAITNRAADVLNRKDNPLGDDVRARLTTMLIEMRRQGEEWPLVDSVLINEAKAASPKRTRERADSLLLFLGANTSFLGASVELHRDRPGNDTPIIFESQAVSESMNNVEVQSLLLDLTTRGLITQRSSGKGPTVTVMAAGQQRIEELLSRVESAQAFVAMWFDESMNKAYEDAFAPAIQDAGYKPIKIDNQEFTGMIEDQIKEQIKLSRFVVADFSHGTDGVRGSVYYEVGFADGLDIQVIFTARSGSDVHFDLSHRNRIEWDENNLPKLRIALKKRILAVTKSAAVDSPND